MEQSFCFPRLWNCFSSGLKLAAHCKRQIIWATPNLFSGVRQQPCEWTWHIPACFSTPWDPLLLPRSWNWLLNEWAKYTSCCFGGFSGATMDSFWESLVYADSFNKCWAAVRRDLNWWISSLRDPCARLRICFRGKDHSLVLPTSVFESTVESLILPEVHSLCRWFSNLSRQICCSAEGCSLSALGSVCWSPCSWIWHGGPGALHAPLLAGTAAGRLHTLQ